MRGDVSQHATSGRGQSIAKTFLPTGAKERELPAPMARICKEEALADLWELHRHELKSVARIRTVPLIGVLVTVWPQKLGSRAEAKLNHLSRRDVELPLRQGTSRDPKAARPSSARSGLSIARLLRGAPGSVAFLGGFPRRSYGRPEHSHRSRSAPSYGLNWRVSRTRKR